MKPIKQLFRQPIRTALALILLTATAAFLCLGWGVLRSAEATVGEIDESIVTLACMGPNYTTGNEYELEYEPETGVYIAKNEWEVIQKKEGNKYKTILNKAEFDDALEEYLRGVYQMRFMSAYVPELRTVTSAGTAKNYSYRHDSPYNRVIMIFRLTDASSPEYFDSADSHIFIHLYGEVVEYLTLHPDYEPRSKVEISCSIRPEDYEAVLGDMEPGKTYIVNMAFYTAGYVDDELKLRTHIASSIRSGFTAADVDWANIKREKGQYWYDVMEEWGYAITLEDYDLESIDRCSYSIGTGEVGTLAPLEGTLEEFLADEANADWVRSLEASEIQYSTVPVFGTDLLKSIHLFHENIAYVTSGRSFVSGDYTEGRRVCLISEPLAEANGLKVGDKLELNLYDGGVAGSDYEAYHAQFYYNFTKIKEAQEYEIIGIYANTQAWSTGAYNFTPNAVFVPNGTLPEAEYRGIEGDILKGIVVKNGTPELITALFKEKGWPEDLLVFFDSGYSKIEDTVAGFTESAEQLFWVACAAFLVILIAYIALFVTRQRRNAGLMLSLGAGWGRTALFVFMTSWVPAAAATALGAVLGAFLLNRAVNNVLGDALLEAGFAEGAMVMPDSVLAAALAMLAVTVAVLMLVSLILSRRKPLKLMKK